MRVLTSLVALWVFMPAMAPATEPIAAANAFWSILVKGDLTELEKQYADKVFLKAGSELLKPVWGIAQAGDRAKGKTVTKAELIKGYKSLIGKVGREKWKTAFGALGKEQISTRILENKHVLLTVRTGPGDDALEFELAPSKDGIHWLVVSEDTDY